MTSTSPRTIIPGTNRAAISNGRVVGAVPATQRMTITVVLRPENDPAAVHAQTMSAACPLGKRSFLSREEYAQKFGAGKDDVSKIEAFAKDFNLSVKEISLARRSVLLSGTVADLSRAFGTKLEQYQHPAGTFCARVGVLSAPTDVAAIIEGVFGLDNRPQAFTRYKFRPAKTAKTTGTFTPPQLAKIYDFPAGADGSGQCIGIIELGGGSRSTDITTYFSSLGLTAPTITIVPVDGGSDAPTTAQGADGEVMLDIEVAGAVAPGASIAVYFAPNTDQGFLDAVTTAVHDTVNKPSVISISWGGAEVSWTQQSMTAFESAFTAAAAMGVTICVAAGDNGSTDGQTNGTQNVDFPASAPHALACGGTSLVLKDGVRTETVWNDGTNSATGGGYSTVFPIPSYQSALKFPQQGRGVPDVAGDADPDTGYNVRVDGQDMVIGGTSAVAPLWAGLIALLNQQLGHPIGFLNPLLYGPLQGANVTNDITVGNNGAQSAAPGWDACTGWGTPSGQNLLAALKAQLA